MLLVERGLFPSRAKAQAAIMAGKVLVPGHAGPKAGLELAPDVEVEILPNACPYVSRGGLKLEAALEAFHIDPRSRVCLDLGSSTGGFTDCLLQRGAAKVYAVDVGTKQLDIRLRKDPRVVVMENTHARDLSPGLFDPRPDLLACDVSFISLTMVVPHAIACLKPPADLLLLVKPQFELEPKKVPKGVVKDPAFRVEALERVRKACLGLRLEEGAVLESPLKGAKGNVELLSQWRLP